MGADRAAPASRPDARGRPRRWPLREILNGIFYVLRGGIAWRLLPSDLPPKSTVFRWFSLWRDTGLFETINHLLVMVDRERVGREASPTAAVLDSQSVKTTESGGPRGYDAGKKVTHEGEGLDDRVTAKERHDRMIDDRQNGARARTGPVDRRTSRTLRRR